MLGDSKNLTKNFFDAGVGAKTGGMWGVKKLVVLFQWKHREINNKEHDLLSLSDETK